MAFDPLTAILDVGGKIIDKVWPDPTEAARAKIRMMELAQAGELETLKADVQLALGQIEINKVEAQSGSVFIGGWRPAVGWVCVAGLVYTFVGQPLLAWASVALGIDVPPDLDLSALVTLLGGLLGIGTMRSYEKVKGVASVRTTKARARDIRWNAPG